MRREHGQGHGRTSLENGEWPTWLEPRVLGHQPGPRSGPILQTTGSHQKSLLREVAQEGVCRASYSCSQSEIWGILEVPNTLLGGPWRQSDFHSNAKMFFDFPTSLTLAPMVQKQWWVKQQGPEHESQRWHQIVLVIIGFSVIMSLQLKTKKPSSP